MEKKHGHYCKVCGEYKSNENFSGKGHAAHICKKCAALPAAQRSEDTTLTKLWNLPWQLSGAQKDWLGGLRNDSRPEIADTARSCTQAAFLTPHEMNAKSGFIYGVWSCQSTVKLPMNTAIGASERSPLFLTVRRIPFISAKVMRKAAQR